METTPGRRPPSPAAASPALASFLSAFVYNERADGCGRARDKQARIAFVLPLCPFSWTIRGNEGTWRQLGGQLAHGGVGPSVRPSVYTCPLAYYLTGQNVLCDYS